MSIFKRAIRLFLWVCAAVAAVIAGATALLVRHVMRPPRHPLWGSPAELGLPFQTIHFPARDDGLRLEGWFIPAQPADPAEPERPRPAVALVHGWTWHRLGERGEGGVASLLRAEPVELLRLAFALQRAGYHVLMFDQRNHGESAADGSVTFGYREANDLLGALDYLQSRPEVDPTRIGVIGFSMGANATLFALARTAAIRAAIAVQPATPQLFLQGLARDVVGPLGQLVVPLAAGVTGMLGGTPPGAVRPVFAAASAAATPLLYIQAAGDAWGSVDDVAAMAERTPGTVDTIILADSGHRYDGYRYLVDRPEIALSFLENYLTTP